MKRNIWVISDTHFRHNKMLEYCGRPADFDKRLIKGLKMVGEEEILIHLGDITIGSDLEVHEEIIKKIKGKKILVRGNHDHKSDNWYFDHGWDFVCREFATKINKKRVLFSHIPVLYDTERYDLNVHGHLHDNRHRGDTKNFEFEGRIYKLISVEFNDYKPVLLNKLIR